jgi:hypothetical protein
MSGHPSRTPWTAPRATTDVCWCDTVYARKGCPQHRQPRERAVPCVHCGRLNWNLNATCDPCTDKQDRIVAQLEHETAS